MILALDDKLIISHGRTSLINELFASMMDRNLFSKIDLKQMYLQLPLAEQDRERQRRILTLNTHKGY